MSTSVPPSLVSLAQEMDHTGQQLLQRWEPEQARRFGALVQCLQGLAEQSGAEPLQRANAELAAQLRGWGKRRRTPGDVMQLRQQLSLVTQLASLPRPAQPASGLQPLRQSQRLFLLADAQALPTALPAQLACFGYVLEVFDSLPALQQALRQHVPGALIIHHDFDGGELVLPQLRLSCPLLFTSTRRDFTARLQAVRAGGKGFLGWPLSVRELLETLGRAPSVDPRNPLRVLLVEDMSSLSGLYAAVLNQHGIHTEEVHRPSETLEAIERFRPDLILMDMHMPECSGQELARIIRQQQLMDGIPILFLTMEKAQDVQLDALNVGVDGYLTKPVSSEELVVTVSTRASRYRKLRSYIATDSLTGLLNHSHLFAQLEYEFARARRERKPLSMVMLDLDHFKQVNDSYGHQAGDDVLISLSRFLRERLRRSDLIGRYGGEEFAIAMPGVGSEQAMRLMQELRESFARLEHASPRGRFLQTFSAGVCDTQGVWDLVALVQRADSMLYRAKEAGRNQVMCWSAADDGGV